MSSVFHRFEHSCPAVHGRRTFLLRTFVSPLVGVPSKMGACFELSELEMFAYRTHRMRVSRSMLLISTLRDRPLRETRKSDRKVRLPLDSRAWSVKANKRHNLITVGSVGQISTILAESLFSKMKKHKNAIL